MKLTQIAILVFTLSAGYSVNAQETVRRSEEPIRKIGIAELKLTPEQTATNRATELKSKLELTGDQFTSVKNLFLKIENRRASFTNLSDAEKSKANSDLQSAEDRELNSILSPSQQKLNSGSKTTTKTATNM
jgi:hypothetical protein